MVAELILSHRVNSWARCASGNVCDTCHVTLFGTFMTGHVYIVYNALQLAHFTEVTVAEGNFSRLKSGFSTFCKDCKVG